MVRRHGRVEALLRQLRGVGAGAMDPVVAIAQQPLRLEEIELGEADLGEAVRDRVQVLGPVGEVVQDGLRAAVLLDVVPQRERELVAVVTGQALHANLEQPVEALAGPRLALGGWLDLEAGLQDPELLDVVGVGELVRVMVALDRPALVDGVLRDPDAPARAVDDLLDVDVGLDHHVDPQVVPAVERPAELGLEPARERVRRRDHELIAARDVPDQLVPRDLVDHRHGPLRTEAVERLPLPDALLLDGQRGKLSDPCREPAHDLDVLRGQAAAGGLHRVPHLSVWAGVGGRQASRLRARSTAEPASGA